MCFPSRNEFENQQISVPQFAAMKGSGRKITMLTAYDFAMAGLVDSAGIDGILVGDTLSMVVQGHATTLPVTLEEMIYHAEMVGRAVRHALVVVDMPFPSFHLGVYKAIENAGRILKESRCQAVKFEGGVEQAEVIAALVSAGIPVMAHCGLRRRASTSSADTACSATRGNCWPTPRPPNLRRVRHRLGVHSGRDGRKNHRLGEDSHHRHRRRRRLRRPDSRHQRSARTESRPRAASRQGIRRSEDHDIQAVMRYRDEVRDGKFPGKEPPFREKQTGCSAFSPQWGRHSCLPELMLFTRQTERKCVPHYEFPLDRPVGLFLALGHIITHAQPSLRGTESLSASTRRQSGKLAAMGV